MGVISVALLALGLAAGIVMVPAKSARADEIPVIKDNFPDDNLRDWVLENYGDTLSDEEITNSEEIDISGKGIKDLTGIEYFTEIVYFDCSQNDISKLDLTTFHNLNFLYCSKTKITELNTSNNHHVQEIICIDCPLTDIDVTRSVILKVFDVESDDLIFVDLSMNTMLEKVSVKSDKFGGTIYLPPNVEELTVPIDWEMKILTKDKWFVKRTDWITDDPSGYAYADIVFQYDPTIKYYEVTVRIYATLVSAKYASCEIDGEYVYEAFLPQELSRTGEELTYNYRQEIPATGHDWGDWYVSRQATVNKAGEERRICRHDASHFETRSLKKLTPTPTKKPVATITLNKKNAEVVAGKTITLKATVKG